MLPEEKELARLEAEQAELKERVSAAELQHVPTAMNRDSQDTPEVRV
jgi:hypothetical protein